MINKNNLKLFTTAFIQVYLVAISTVCLAHSVYVGVILASFFISFSWTFNVSKIAICSMAQRIIYSSGACIGSILGLLTTYRGFAKAGLRSTKVQI